MPLSNDFFIDVKNIRLAHEFTLDKTNKCEYRSGRGSYGLVYIIGGEANYHFSSGDVINAKEGNTLFFTPDSAYYVATKDKFHHYTINFDIHPETSVFEFLNNPCGFLKIEDTKQIEFLFKKLIGFWNSKTMQYKMNSTSVLYELLAFIYTELISKNENTANPRMIIAKEYIDQNFNKPLSLEKLAHISNMSVTNFRREWTKYYKVPPLKYRDSLRLYYAKQYLDSGFYSIKEISERCGFDDVSYFVRFFKKHSGTTPGNFSKSYIKKQEE